MWSDMFCRLLGEQGKSLHGTCGGGDLLQIELKCGYQDFNEVLQGREGRLESLRI